MTYQELNEFIKKGRTPTTHRRITRGHNTIAVRRGENIAIQLHSTDVVTYRPDGSIVLDSGGWRTPTTKDRMNDGTGVWLWSDRSVWYFTVGRSRWDENATVYVYQDGVVIHSDGSVTGAGTKEQASAHKKLLKRVDKYAKDFVEALLKGLVPPHSGGDCWDCYMHCGDGRTLGECTSSDHIISHMDEGYFVPSLLVNALEEYPVSRMGEHLMHCLWESGEKVDGQYWVGLVTEQIQKSIKKFVRKQLDMAG